MKKVPVLAWFLCISIFSEAQIVINEVCSTNADIKYDPNYYNFSGWIELYNKGTGSVNIGGYYLTDTPGQFTWKVPANTTIVAKGYLLIWCDNKKTGMHTDFSLDSDGGDIVLYSSVKEKLDEVVFAKQFINVSYGRVTDGGSSWNYLSSVTPGTQNISSTATLQLEKPNISLKPGRYASQQTTTITHPVAGVVIRYTLNGAEPTITSSTYNSSITISQTSTLKAKAFHNAYISSNTEVKTFFINEHVFTLPVISLSTAPDYLWNTTIGIYTDGTNGTLGNCQDTPKNWNQDWERHAVFEYFKKSGDRDFDQSLGIRIGGACSRAFPQKSFVMRARDEYGKKTINQQFFKTKNIDLFGSFILRNSGNDFNMTMFRDALEHSLVIGQMDIDYLAYQPTTFYINGQYWGIQNLREKIDADYFKSNYGIEAGDLDLLEYWGGNILEGSADRYWIYLDSLQKVNLSDPASFKFIERYIDVQEFINYLTTEIYYGNTDWPGNNVKFWRQRSNNGKFRWVLWDMDFGFELYSGQSSATHPTLEFATATDGPDWPNPPWSTLNIRLLLQNPVFKTKFIQTLTTAMHSTFKPERVIGMIDDFADLIRTEMPYHKTRWGGTIADWNYEVQRLRDFATTRNAYMQAHTKDFFGLGDNVNFSVSSSPVNSGGYKLNGITSNDNMVNVSYYKGLPYQIEPAANDGFVFKKWKITERESSTVSIINKGETWKYFDQGTSPGTGWQTAGFNDAAWTSGPAQLGYGDGDEQTVVNYGGDVSNKYVTTYFRKLFNVADIQGIDDIKASVLFDDGIVVYLNGTEVYRNALPAGTVSNNTLANETIETNVYNSFTIDAGLLVQGQNTLAVEVHQVTLGSSDISFDFEMQQVKLGDEITYETTAPTIVDTASTDVIIEAIYEPVPSVSGIIINEFCAANSIEKDDFNETEDWIELYNKSNETIDVGGLFITDNLNNETKHRILKGDPNTILSPGEYLILWADENISQGARHLNFKLSSDGEQVGLYQLVGQDTLALDEVIYKEQYDDVSMSRIPNITGPFIQTSKVTPLAENIFQVVVVPITGVEEDPKFVSVYPNPSSTDIFIRSESTIDEVVIYDVIGSAVGTFKNVKTNEPLAVSDLRQGLYLVKVRVGSKEVLVKFIKQD
jgi:hypothetical protein